MRSRRISDPASPAGRRVGYTPAMSKTLSAALAGITLPDTNGQETRLGSLWHAAPAIVVFLRHYG